MMHGPISGYILNALVLPPLTEILSPIQFGCSLPRFILASICSGDCLYPLHGMSTLYNGAFPIVNNL